MLFVRHPSRVEPSIFGGSTYLYLMKVFVYIDESGVFDKKHNDWFVFGGIVFFGIEAKNAFERNYRFLEEKIRKAENLPLEIQSSRVYKTRICSWRVY